MKKVTIIGAGLAGAEAAYFLARNGIKVTLYEMRPEKVTPAHQTGNFAELVCSNSLKSENLEHASGLLKKELAVLKSLILRAARATKVPAGSALSVDRELFSEYITKEIRKHKNIEVINEEVTKLPKGIVIVATGPLTSEALTKELQTLIGQDFLSFYDASAPIITKDSIDLNIAYFKSRYEQSDDAYLNCPFTKEEYDVFHAELKKAETVKLRDFEKKYFEACMPIEVLAKRGVNTMRYGPLKPKGLERKDYPKPHAVLQLRQDNLIGSLYNLVGFQTNLTYSEQERVFRLIPGLKEAEFVRFGLMHRNTFINAPAVLNRDFSLKMNKNVYIAGQLSGVEGYVESAANGLFVALNVLAALTKKEVKYPRITMLGALMHYVVHANPNNFTPMNANFGLLPSVKKKERLEFAKEAILKTKEIAKLYG
ncbi:MAG TPA: methylenetetrahydrofolate--tRNA-(uracil(54)-C(5))-methyltransferase (FADH(2)-oxidizing) TrmFO [Bacilli bacterium]|nr:methylenetetrahydrofolate--tRNA-(uracil(54)-C(5))-methyltransferase (FADH(2)-oxidizing) TrmFO [Bacilli bacterium]